MRLHLGPNALLRLWAESDAAALARNANNPKVAANLRDRFPHPYGIADAERFIARAPPSFFCIEVDGEAAGGIGFHPGNDVERFSAELGYWLAEPHWGKGLTTAAVKAITKHVFVSTEIQRVFALPYAPNRASCRVLEKSGYVLEGRLRMSSFKLGSFVDQYLFAAIRPEWLSGQAGSGG